LIKEKKTSASKQLMAEKLAVRLSNESRALSSQIESAGGALSEKIREQIIREALQPYFSKAQMDRLLNQKNTRWSEEDLNNSILLLCISTRAYQILRLKYKYPLPSITTMKNYLSELHCCPGLMVTNLKLLEVKAARLKPIEKILVGSFDEAKVHSIIVYYHQEDRVLGPHQNAQVIFVRPLFGTDWGTEIFYDFDVPVTVELMNFISEKLYLAGGWVLKVWTCDLGPTNRGLHKKLNIDSTNQEFPHPVTKEKQFLMSDSPHHLKNARSHLMDTGVILNPSAKKKDQLKACRTPLAQLVDLTPMAELTQMHKLTWKHIECRQMERQRVRPATETLSNSVSISLLEAGDKGRIKSPHYKVILLFLKNCTKFSPILSFFIAKFIIMCSRQPASIVPSTTCSSTL